MEVEVVVEVILQAKAEKHIQVLLEVELELEQLVEVQHFLWLLLHEVVVVFRVAMMGLHK
jgi:hypothetical protein